MTAATCTLPPAPPARSAVPDVPPLPPPPAPMPCSFEGASIKLYGAHVLLVVVHPWVLHDPIERELHVIAFRTRFRRTIVLVARDRHGTPTYWGPAAIVRALGVLPFEALSWERYLYRRPPPPMLPIPVDPPPLESTSGALERDLDATTIRLPDDREP
ncbi:MAG TPA: hypothetical protein VFQ53_34060 [Kofleriaceae bacterium]|nr:hypothetical protein [Kofleriaceae bacterium]